MVGRAHAVSKTMEKKMKLLRYSKDNKVSCGIFFTYSQEQLRTFTKAWEMW